MLLEITILKMSFSGQFMAAALGWIYSAEEVFLPDLKTWFRNITVTILDTIHRPVFYLKLNSIQLYRSVRTSQETQIRNMQQMSNWGAVFFTRSLL
jgi:hypothetical protein